MSYCGYIKVRMNLKLKIRLKYDSGFWIDKGGKVNENN